MEPLITDQPVDLVTFYYLQIDGARAIPVLIGFRSEMEREFFEHFIQVASIGPRSAVKALSVAIPRIAMAIERGDVALLRTLPGIGAQKAKEIIAKLQGRSGRFCLIPDEAEAMTTALDIGAEALEVLLTLGHKRREAEEMIRRAMACDPPPTTTERLLDLAYKTRPAEHVEP
jgi:Holliday junction DNA helicase RuvA